MMMLDEEGRTRLLAGQALGYWGDAQRPAHDVHDRAEGRRSYWATFAGQALGYWGDAQSPAHDVLDRAG